MSAPPRAFGADPFPPTRWTLLDAARDDVAGRRAALEDLARRYGPALFAVARRRGLARADAEDAVQALCEKILEEPSFFDALDRTRGRFRAFLRTAFERLLVTRREAALAAKRGAGRVVALDAAAAEAISGRLPVDADAAFDRAWAEALVARARDRLRARRAAEGRGAESALIDLYLAPGATAPPLATAAAAHGISVAALKAAVHRARVAFRASVREEILAEGSPEQDVDAEIAALAKALAT